MRTLCFLALTGCLSDYQADIPPEAFEPPPANERAALVGGGGRTSSARFQARVAVGAPGLAGEGSSNAGSARVGAQP